MGIRAGIVVTGTEVLTGRVADRNGPWLAEALRVVGVDVAHIVVVGDRPQDLLDALGFVAGTDVDLIVTSGGLGPTADDLTAETVAAFQGRTTVLDAELETTIATIIARFSARAGWRHDPEATAAATRKQALVPEGAAVLAPVGTAPGLVVPPAEGRRGVPVIVLPGPPRELRGMWPAVLEDATVGQILAAGTELRQRTMRVWGRPESELAAMLRTYEAQLAGMEITTCLRDGELEIVARFVPSAQAAYQQLERAVIATFGDAAFSPDGRTVDQVVADALLERGLTIATAESCTAGLLAGRLTELAGSSAYVRGGIVAYSNEVKQDQVGVPAELIERVGAVSAEVAQALASGVRDRLGTNLGVGITGVAGPGGGSAEKPVGLVYLCVMGDDNLLGRRVVVPGAREDVRRRSVAIAMHLIRELLAG